MFNYIYNTLKILRPLIDSKQIIKQEEKAPEYLVSQINDLQKNDPNISFLDALQIVFRENKTDFSESECVKRGFEKYKDDEKFQAKTQDQKLGFLYGVCRSKGDFEFVGNLVHDSINDLVKWVLAEGITSDRKEAKIIAFKIANSKKASKKEDKPKEENWKETWNKVGEGFDKQREARLEKWGWAYKKRGKGRPRNQGRPRKKDLLTEDGMFEELGLRRKTPEELESSEKEQNRPKSKEEKWEAKIRDIIQGLESEYKNFYSKEDQSLILNRIKGLNQILNSKQPFEKKKLFVGKAIDTLWGLFRKVESRYGQLEGVGSKIKYYVKPWHDPKKLEKYGKELEEQYNYEHSFTGMGLKRSGGKGKGWHGEPERHSKARKTGRADMEHEFVDIFGKPIKLTKSQKDLLVLLNGENDTTEASIFYSSSFSSGTTRKNLWILNEYGLINFNYKLKSRLWNISEKGKKYLKLKGQGKGWHGEPERHSQAAKKGAKLMGYKHDFKLVGNVIKHDFVIINDFINDLSENTITEVQLLDLVNDLTNDGLRNYFRERKAKKDEVAQRVRSRVKATTEEEELKKLIEEIKTKGQETPQSTGQGGLTSGNMPMTAVQSSMIKGAGVFNGQLLIEYHHDPGNIYPYPTENGRELFDKLMASGSKGEWVWKNLLGKPSKYGMAKGTFHAYNDENGDPQFSTSKGAQFVHLKGRPGDPIANPVGYVGGDKNAYNIKSIMWKELKEKGYEEFAQKWKGLGTSSELWDDPTVQAILKRAKSTTEVKLEKARKAKREKKMRYKAGASKRSPVGQSITKKFGKEVWAVGSKGIKVSSDFEYVGNVIQDTEYQGQDKRLSEQIAKLEAKLKKLNLQSDFIPIKQFKQIKYDFQTDFTVFRGPIVRDGGYVYKDRKTGKNITLYKEWDNLKDIYSRYDYLPMKVAEDLAHYANHLGFGYEFTPNENTHEIEATLVFVNDQDHKQLIDLSRDYHVSPGYHDEIIGNIQYVKDLDHIALSLGKERARSCSGVNKFGKSCTTVQVLNHNQNLTEVVQ